MIGQSLEDRQEHGKRQAERCENERGIIKNIQRKIRVMKDLYLHPTVEVVVDASQYEGKEHQHTQDDRHFQRHQVAAQPVAPFLNVPGAVQGLFQRQENSRGAPKQE